jgi:transcriptional antiterminator
LIAVSVETFRERLDLLEESGQVSAPVRQVTSDIVRELDRRRGPLTDDNAGTLVSHLALSLERLRQGVVLEPDPLVIAEAAQYGAALALASEIARPAKRLGAGQLPDSEVAFLAIHIRLLEDTGGPT